MYINKWCVNLICQQEQPDPALQVGTDPWHRAVIDVGNEFPFHVGKYCVLSTIFMDRNYPYGLCIDFTLQKGSINVIARLQQPVNSWSASVTAAKVLEEWG